MAPPKRPGASRRKDGAGSVGSGSSGLAKLLLIGLAHAGALAAYVLYRAAATGGGPPEVTPLRAPRMKELPEWDTAYKSNMLWGSYRSGLYFGMSTRSPEPLLMGLMWFDPTDPQIFAQNRVRHEALQDDKLSSYGWVRHDGRSYGRQELVDGDYRITVQMVKSSSPSSGFGGDWAVRVRAALSEAGKARQEEARAKAAEQGAKPPRRKLALVFYAADAHWPTSELEVWPDGQQAKLDQGVQLLAGSSDDVGGWEMHLRPAPGAEGGAPSKGSTGAQLSFFSARIRDSSQLVKAKQAVVSALAQRLRNQGGNVKALHLPNAAAPQPNLAFFQATASLPAAFDLTFVSNSGEDGERRLDALSGDALTELAARRESLFDERFSLTFPTREGGAPPGLGRAAVDEASKAALSNLLGSMGYFHGASRVRLPPGSKPPAAAAAAGKKREQQQQGGGGGEDPLVVDYWPDALYTATPSRSFFPRGFLWDEGFHQLLVARWDPQLSRDAVGHWLDLINRQGWIPREQILGEEARARVPAEFVVQHPSHANPPSLFLPLLLHARSAAGAADAAQPEVAATRAFLLRAWPRLEAWYRWFNGSQAATTPGAYMWKGRDGATEAELNPKTLMSGLDDYPRASHPTDDERHVDLLAWMALASQAMAEIGHAAGAPAKAVERYASAAAAIGSLERLRELHYDEGSGQFRDYGLHTERVELVWRETPQGEGQPPKRELVRQVSEPPRLQLVPSFGYVSLFPLLMRLLPPDSQELGRQLELLQSEELLWTPHGLRSLAPNSSIYKKYNTEHDAPYWRGQVWVNVNFLALSALKHYASAPGPHAAAAGEACGRLRSNLLGTLVGRYNTTGYLWEQYDDGDGAPKGSHPFTGWSALLTLVASEVF